MCGESISPHLRRKSQRPPCDNRTSLSSSVILFPSYSLPYALTLPLLSALSLSSLLCVWLMKKNRINGVSALHQQKCGMEINLLAKDKRAAKITAGKRKLHQTLILEGGGGVRGWKKSPRGRMKRFGTIWQSGEGSGWAELQSSGPTLCRHRLHLWMMHSLNGVRHGFADKELCAY